MNEIFISEKYQPLFELLQGNHPQVDTVIITGGRYSLKSYTVSIFANTALRWYDWNTLYTRYTNSTIVESIKPEVSDKLELLGIHNDVLDTESKIKYGENRIAFKGIKPGSKAQTANLKSLSGFNCFINDEAEEIPDLDTFKKIFYSIRSADKRNLSILILNPTTKAHWIYKEYYEPNALQGGENCIKDNVMFIHSSYLDCTHSMMPPNILADFKKLKIKNPTKYDNVVGGGWLNKAEGVIFENWEYGDFDESLPYGYGMDFGFFPDPDVLVKVAIDNKRKKIYCKQVLKMNNAGTDELANNIKKHKNDRYAIIADCAEPRLINDLIKHSINVRAVVKGAGSVLAGIKTMQDYELIIHPDSTDIGKELNNYVWSDKKSGIPVDAFNHWIDAIRYYVSTNTRPSLTFV